MKITEISIRNFRGIKTADAADLGDTVIIAGQNGSGKSCIFDAIRLLKSVYGGYQQDEYQQFFGEFQIQLHGNQRNLKRLFNDPNKELSIRCTFQLREQEKAYISENAAELLKEAIWREILPEAFQGTGYQQALFSSQLRNREEEVIQRVKAELPVLAEELEKGVVTAQMIIDKDHQIKIDTSKLLNVVFTNYRPREIGVIDYHGAQRHYGRESINGVQLSFQQQGQNLGQHALYNYGGKYSNVKSEMAAGYIRQILSDKALGASSVDPAADLETAMKELFKTFFPDKTFVGAVPTIDGSLSFPVRTKAGAEHDLDELSSGEKEILYGYLRMRSSAPKDSIILLDEPELHLNPRLIRGLPEFYRKYLGEALQNQIWLVTHSDSLIRETIGKSTFSVFHMTPSSLINDSQSQLRPLLLSKELEVVLTDLVGDLAAYRPGGKGVIFEGGGDSDFDKTLVSILFSEEIKGINLISGSNKARVKLLHETLDNAYKKGDFKTKFFAIVDKDSEAELPKEAVTIFSWDVYHIENYLLVPEIIKDVLNSLSMDYHYSALKVTESLKTAAQSVIPEIISHKLQEELNRQLISRINLGFDPKTSALSKALLESVTRSVDKINELHNSFTETSIRSMEDQFKSEIDQSFLSNLWMKTLPGRAILKQLLRQESLDIKYEKLRSMIVYRMQEKGYKPEGMSKVINQICAA